MGISTHRYIYHTILLTLVSTLIIIAGQVQGQTTVFSDDFSTNQNTLYTTSGPIGTSPWTVNRSGDDWGARINTLPAQLELINDVGGIANTNGWILAYASTATFAAPYNTTLDLNTSLVTWSFNMRQIRTDPAGFGATSYGIAFILGGTSTTANNAGTGYAVVLGQSGSTDPVRLVSYENGLQGTLTTILTSNTVGLTDFGADYLSIKVTFNPSTDLWELFLRNDGASFFADPSVGSLTSQGTANDNTYTSTVLTYLGGYWQGSTSANQIAFLDNVKVTLASGVSPTINLSATTLIGFTYVVGTGPSLSQTYNLSASNLTGFPGNITITGETDYEVSHDNSNFSASVDVSYTSDAVASTPIYVRLKAGLIVDTYTGSITHAGGGATTVSITCSGYVSCLINTLPYNENFNYSTGSLLTDNCWTAHSAEGTNPVTITASSITYPSYTSSGIGNEITLTHTGEDCNMAFTPQNSNSLYASFLVNATIAQTTGNYFAHFGETSGISVSNFGGKVWIKKDPGSANFAFGISKTVTDANVSYTGYNYSVGTTYLVVVKYNFVAGTTNDDAVLFINPVLGSTEPSATISTLPVDNTTTDLPALSSFCLRQGSASSSPSVILDGIRISTIWSDIAGSSEPPSLFLINPVLSGFTYVTGGGPSTSQTYNLSGTNLTGFPGNISITGSSNYEVSLDNSLFVGSVNLAYSSATLSGTPIYVRLKAGLPINPYNNELIVNAGGGSTILNVRCNGIVTDVNPCPANILPHYENFNYTTSSLLTDNCWTAHSAPGTNPVTVSAGSIMYPCYFSSGIGNEVTLTNAVSAEDVNLTFTSVNSGTVYASFLVNVSSATTTGDYFFHLGPNIIGTTFKGRIFVKKDASENLYFGISHSSATAAIYTTTTYSLGTTYIIVLKYTINPGVANDVASIYINPTLNAIEPATGWLVNIDTPTDPTDIGSVALRQGSLSNAPTLILDGIIISDNWADIVTSAQPTPTISGSPTTFCAGSSLVLTSSAGTGNQWYKDGLIIIGATAQTYSATASGSYTVTATDGNGCSATSAATVVTVNPLPAAPTVGTITQPTCALATATIALSDLPTSAWMVTANPGGATIAGSTATANFSGLTAGTTYTFTVTLTSSGCTSAASDPAVITAQPVTPSAPIVETITQPTCALATATVALSGLPTLAWTVTANPGGATIAGSTATADFSGLTASTTYTFTVTLTSSGCTSIASSNAVIITQPVTLSAPTLSSVTQPTCTVVTGNFNITNYNASYTYIASPSAGVTIFGSTVTAPTGTYTITATSGSCTSPASDMVTVNTQPPPTPAPTGDATQYFCSIPEPTVALLTATGTVIKWYSVANGGTALGSTTPLTAPRYYASQTVDGCESVTRFTVDVIKITSPGTVSIIGGNVTSCQLKSGLIYSVTLVPGTTYTWTIPPGWTASTTHSGLNINSITVTSGNVGDDGNIEVSAVNACPASPSTSSLGVSVIVPPVVSIDADYCIVSPKIRLTALPGPSTDYNYQWTRNGTAYSTNQVIDVSMAGTYAVTVTNSTGCFDMASTVLSTEMVTNGKFDLFNDGSFYTGYTYQPDIEGNSELEIPEGKYGIGPDPHTYHRYFWGRDYPSNTGNFMIINGVPNKVAWGQTIENLVIGTTYYFSAWAISLNNSADFASLQFQINGTPIGSVVDLPGRIQMDNPPYNWLQFYGSWEADVTTATLEIIDLQTSAVGNDFGLDDISFGTLTPTFMSLDATANGGGPVCADGALNLSVRISGGRPPYTFEWKDPLGNVISNDQYPSISPVTLGGIYTVTIDDDYGCAPVTASTDVVTILPLPTATITGGTSVCLEAAEPLVTFTGSGSTAPYTFTYHINTGTDLTISTTAGVDFITLPVPTHIAGNFTYTLTNVQGSTAEGTPGCTQPQIGVAVFNIKGVNATISSSVSDICEGETAPTITFTGTGGTPTYTFNYTVNTVPQSITTFPGNSSISIQVPAPALTYTYSLVSVTSSGCTQPVAGTVSVTVYPRPVITINGPSSVCLPSTGNLYTTEAGMSNYTWSVSAGGTITGGGTSADNTTTIDWTVAGIPTVSVNYTLPNGCGAVTSKVFEVGVNIGMPDPPTTIPSDNMYVCAPASGVAYSVTYIAGVTYTWNYSGTGATINGQGTNSITIDFASDATSGQLSVTTSNLCGTNATAQYRDIIISMPRIASAGSNQTVCSSSPSVSLSGSYSAGTGTTPTVNWSGGTGTFANPALLNTTYTFGPGENSGSVTLTLTVTSGTCTPPSTSQVVITINQAATVNAGSNQSMCVGSSILLTGSIGGGATSAAWSCLPPIGFSFLPNNTSLTTNFSSSIAGTKTIRLTTNDPVGPCPSAISTIQVIVNPLPTITLGISPSVCSGTTTANLTYSATSGSPNQYNIVWSAAAIAAGFVNVTNAVLPTTPIVLVVPGAAAPASYAFSLTVSTSSNGCLSTSYNKLVTVYPLPTTSNIYHQ